MLAKLIISNFFLKFLMITLIIIPLTSSSTFQEFKSEMEQVVIEIAQKMQEHYTNWCSEGVGKCQTLTVNACLGVTEKSCNIKFPKPVICFYDGQYISNTSNVNFPIDLDFDKLNEDEIRFICSSAKLQTTFQSLANNRQNKFTSMYFGNKRGIFRMFPGYFYGTEQRVCDQYDPRYRPWYTIAVSGAKNVIILLDKSRSMLQNEKQFEIAKDAVKNVIQTLSISDNIAIIAFQNSTQIIGIQKLSKATNQYKQKLKVLVDGIVSYQGQTNYWKAFETGLNIVKNAITSEQSGCIQAENVFLLVTDGNPTQDIIKAQVLIKKIQDFLTSNSMKSIQIFAYALGETINIEFLKTLSCAFKGILISQLDSKSPSNSSSAVISKLADFYAYLAVGVKFKNPVWTEPYTDYYGYGRMVTVSMPAYQTDPATNISELIGVAGADIIMSRFDEYGLKQQDIVFQLTGQSACQKNNLQNCQVQALRRQKYRCDLKNCLTKTAKKCGVIPKVPEIYWNKQLNKDTTRCCGITLNGFIASVVFGTFGSILVMVGILKRKQIWKKFCKRNYRDLKAYRGRKLSSGQLMISSSSSSLFKKSYEDPPDSSKTLFPFSLQRSMPKQNQFIDPL